MRIGYSALALIFGVVACARPAPPTRVGPAASASASAERVPEVEASPAIESLPPPSKPICVLSAVKWSTAYPSLLIGLGTSGSPQFAYVRTGRAKLTIGVGGEVVLEVATPRVVLRGYPEITQFIHTKRAVAFGGWLVPLPGTPLTISSTTADSKIEVDGPTPPHVRALGKRGEAAAVACSDLAIVPQSFDPAPVLPTARSIRKGYLPQKEVPLSTEPGGAPVAILEGAAESPPAKVVAERGAQARLVWNDDDQAIVFGWVERSALSPTPLAPRPPVAPAQRDSPLPEPRHLSGEVVKCAVPVRLVEGGRYGAKSFPTYQVGIIQPQTPIGIVRRDDTLGYASVELEDEPGISFSEGALLLVPNDDLAHCQRDTAR